MNRPSFVSHVIVAFLLAVAGGMCFTLLTPFLRPPTALRLTLGLVATGYVLHVVLASQVNGGRIAAPTLWLLCAAVLAWAAPAPALFTSLHAVLLWLLRALLIHTRVIPVMADLALSALALAVAVACARHTGSLALSLWTFFVIQALPSAFAPLDRGRESTTETRLTAGFERACTRAAALRRSQTHR